ncbi:Efflux pump radE [Colletotrichum tropicale]|nr:Efflux pump radE [Colletotrichum tropicale]
MAESSDIEKGTSGLPTTSPGTFLSAKQPEPNQQDANRVLDEEDALEDQRTVDWDGPDDPDNPMNWPESRKWVNLTVMSILSIISPLGSSMFAPGVPKLMAEFDNSSPMASTFVVSIYFLGFAFGPLVIAPLSEMHGRMYVYHAGNIAFTAFSIGAALSVNLDMLMAFRLLMGVSGSVPTTVGVGSVVDVMKPEKRGRAISLWAIGPLLGPALGPIAGGYLIEAAGWRWVYWLLAILGGAFGVLALLVMRETYAPVLLERKTNAMRKATGNYTLRSKLDTEGPSRIKMALIRPLKFLFRTPLVSTIAVYAGIVYGIFYLLITTFSFVYSSQYDFDEGNTGLSFLPANLGMMIGVLSLGYLQDYLVLRAKRNSDDDGKYKLEVKLTPWITLPAGLLMPAGLLLYGWASHYRVHWIVSMIGAMLFALGLTGATMSLQNYQMDSYPRYAASGSAAVILLRSLIGALMPLGGLKMRPSSAYSPAARMYIDTMRWKSLPPVSRVQQSVPDHSAQNAYTACHADCSDAPPYQREGVPLPEHRGVHAAGVRHDDVGDVRGLLEYVIVQEVSELRVLVLDESLDKGLLVLEDRGRSLSLIATQEVVHAAHNAAPPVEALAAGAAAAGAEGPVHDGPQVSFPVTHSFSSPATVF